MPQEIIQDFVSAGGTGGPVAHSSVAAKLLTGGFRASSLRTNDVLRKEEWKQFDAVVVEVARERLGIVEDLITRGLTLPVGNALGTTFVEWEQSGDMDPAELNMSGVTEGERDRMVFNLKGVPLPITHKDFNINIRALEASRKLGDSLDTTNAAVATRLVSDSLENLLMNGSTLSFAGQTIPGYTTAPNRSTGSVTANWSTVATGEQMVGDVLIMMGAAATVNMFGPFMLYCSVAARNRLNDDYKANSDRTTVERINAIDGIIGVRGTARLAGTVVLLVQMTRDVVDMVVGQQPAPIQWESQGGMIVNFKVMAIMVPRVKDDAKAQSGIVHYS